MGRGLRRRMGKEENGKVMLIVDGVWKAIQLKTSVRLMLGETPHDLTPQCSAGGRWAREEGLELGLRPAAWRQLPLPQRRAPARSPAQGRVLPCCVKAGKRDSSQIGPASSGKPSP